MSDFSWPGGSFGATATMVAVVVGLYLAATWVATIAWTVRDITNRSRSTVAIMAASILVTTTFVAGLALYLILRPRQTLRQRYEHQLEEQVLMQEVTRVHACPNCARTVKQDYIACPACATSLKAECRQCSRAVDFSWSVCAYCAVVNPVLPERSLRPQHTVEPVPAQAPAATVSPEPVISAPAPAKVPVVATIPAEYAYATVPRVETAKPVVGRIVPPAASLEDAPIDDDDAAEPTEFRAAS